MATTNPITLKLSDADATPMAPIRVYKGTRARQGYYGPTYGVPSGMLNQAGSEDFYTDETGKPIEGPFDPKRHSVIGDIKDGIRTPYQTNSDRPDWLPRFGPQYSGPMARPQPYSGPMARPSGNQAAVNPMDAVRKTFPKETQAPQSTPDAVRASAQTSPAAAAQQKSVAEQQAEYLRSRGMRTAAEADTEFESNLRKDYSQATGFDINTAEGRRASFQAALQRGGHADAMARNLRAGKYAYLDPNSDAGMKASDAAYQKHFKGKDWVGDNPLTGEIKDVDGNIWDSQDAYNQSGMNPLAPKIEPSGEILTPEQQSASNVRNLITRLEGEYDPEMMKFSFIRDQMDPTGKSMSTFQENEAQDYANNAINESLKISNAPVQGPDMKGWGNSVANFLRARVRANKVGDTSLDSLGTGEYNDPNFLHFTKGNVAQSPRGNIDPSVGRDIWAGDTDYDPRLTWGMSLKPMPKGSLEDAIGARNAMNPTIPKRDFDPVSAIRNLGMPPQGREITGRKMTIKRPIR